MGWKSGSTCYLVREEPEAIVLGIQAIAEGEGFEVTASRRRGGVVRLRIEAADSRKRGGLPALDVGEVELRFTARGELCSVEVRSRRRRRYWTLGIVGALGVGTLFVDLIASMGNMTRELERAVRKSNGHHQEADPQLLRAVSSYLAPRELGAQDEVPFRRRVSG